MKSHTILRILFIFFGIALIIFGFINSYFNSNLGINNRIFGFKDENGLKDSGFWETSPFIIDGDESGLDIYQGSDAHNWTWATSQPWCSGMGTWNSPYIIENITINANYIGSCIRIVDTSKYYIIRNVTVYNSGYLDAGIRLEWTENGEILNSSILNNRNGIIFNDNVHDLIIYNNNITNNVHGIYFENYCEYNNISGNRIKNSEYGIRLFNSKYNIISNNLIINENINHGSQRTYGVYLHFSDYNNIFENNIIGTSKCIYEIDCVKNYINDNQCNPVSSFNFGIFITTLLVIFFIVLLAITLLVIRKRSRKLARIKKEKYEFIKEEFPLEPEIEIFKSKMESPQPEISIELKIEPPEPEVEPIEQEVKPLETDIEPIEPEMEIHEPEVEPIELKTQILQPEARAPVSKIEIQTLPEESKIINLEYQIHKKKIVLDKERLEVKEKFEKFNCPFCGYLISGKRNLCPQCGYHIK